MKTQKIKVVTIATSFLIVVLILVLAVFLSNRFIGKDNFFSKVSNKLAPFPAVIVAGDFMSVQLLEDNLIASKRFYENQDFSDLGIRIDFSTEDGKKRLLIKEKNILNKLIENGIIKELLSEKGIKITDEVVSQEVDRKILEMSNEPEVQARLFKLYGWNLNKFKERIVRPDLERERLVTEMSTEEQYFEKALEKIKVANAKIKANEKFENVSKEFSEGESSSSGGSLGWFSPQQMLPEISTEVFTMKKGEVSEILKSQLGFHIIRIGDTKIENKIPMIKVSQIFVRIPTLADWLVEKGGDVKIRLMIDGYIWDKDEFRLKFKDQAMNEMEEDLLNNFQGDISVIF